MFRRLLGEQVHTVELGSGEPAIVGIAGVFGTWEIWQQPFELLAPRHRCVAYDHFGTGLTQVPPERVTFEEQVQLVGALLDDAGIERCVLAGDSAMVAVAVAFALGHPERVDGLVLASGGVEHQASSVVTRFVDGLRRDFEPTVAAFVEFCIPEAGTEHLKRWLRAIIHRTGGERAATLLESLYGIDLRSRLGQLKMPVLVIAGDEDHLPASDVDTIRDLAGRIPDSRLELLPGAGHVPTLTRPREVAEAMEELIAELG